MSKIKIMCTSTGCIEYAPKRYHCLGIEIIRVHVIFEGKEYKEGLDLDPVAFYNRLETIENPKDNLPRTSMPDAEDVYAGGYSIYTGLDTSLQSIADELYMNSKNFSSPYIPNHPPYA